MNTKDEHTQQQMDQESDEEYFDELSHSMLKENKFKILTSLLSKTEAPFVIMGVVILGLIILFFAYPSSGPKQTEDQHVNDLETQISQIEKRLDTLEWTGQKLELLEKQSKSIESFMGRFDRMEAAMSLRMDLLEKKIGQQQTALQKVAAQPPQQIVKAAPPPAVTKQKTSQKKATKSTANPTYYRVQAGDTLYSIGRKHGISVDQLKRLNKSITGEAIYVGQKLLVRSK